MPARRPTPTHTITVAGEPHRKHGTAFRAACSCGWRATDTDEDKVNAQLRANAHRRVEGMELWHKPT